jgi:nitrite reductase (NO-forming)
MTRKMSFSLGALTGLLALASLSRGAEYKPLSEAEIAKLPHIQQKLVPPPGLPEHSQVDEGGFKVIEVRFDIEEKQNVIDDEGTKMWNFTFNGTVPGPMVVAHEGDYIELTLHNKSTNKLQHNIDFHASTGALGGGGLTNVSPGETVKLRYRATRAGVFVYHCAPGGVMIPWHVTHGMNGAVMILPRKGLTDGKGHSLHYDRAYYIGEQDFYLKKGANGKYKRYPDSVSSMADDLDVMRTNNPSHVVFNGRVGSFAGDNALPAKVGETVLFIHESANRDTRPHIIGGHGDYVWERGKFNDPPLTDQETWFICGGSAGAALYKFLQPGVYAYVNHNLIDAVLKGAVGHIKVEGTWNDDLMKQTQKEATEADTK